MALRHIFFAAAAVALGTFSATAAPLVRSAPAEAATSAIEVQYRRPYGIYAAPRVYAAPRYYGRPYAARPYGYRYGYRPFVGFGAAVVAGAVIANSLYAPRRGYYYDTYDYDGPYYYPSGFDGDPREICARHFRSFEWDTGLITTYRGERRMCPYLRL